MKKIMFFAALAGTVGFYACTKDGNTNTITNTLHDTTIVNVFASGKANPDVLTAGIKVAYATPVADSALPAASKDAAAPVLDTTYHRVYSVVKSRYLTIYPPNVSGNVAGYYVQIAGAKSYFKVDYKAANTARKAARAAKAARMASRKSTQHSAARGVGDGYIDSAIVIKLPATINGDTFYVKYAAYDTLNRVSSAITSMVTILPEGTDAFTDSLTGTWNYFSYTRYNYGRYDDWQVDTGYANYANYDCNNNVLSSTDAETNYYLPYNTYTSIWQYTVTKYGFTEQDHGFYKDLDLENSSCSNYVYTSEENYLYNYVGGFSYDRGSRKLTLIYEDQNSNNIELNYSSYYLSELTDSSMTLSYYDDNGDDDYGYLNKFIKDKK